MSRTERLLLIIFSLSTGKIVRAILHGLGHMLRQDVGAPGKVGDRPRDAQDAVIAARGEAHGLKGAAHQLLALRRKRAEAAQLAAAHARVAGGAGGGEAPALDRPGGVHAFFDLFRALRRRAAAQLVEFQSRDLCDDVDAVQQRPGDTALIAAHLRLAALAAPGGMAVPAAFAGVHRAHQHEAAGIGDRAGHARDRDEAVLERLAQHLEHVAVLMIKHLLCQKAI